MTKTKQEMSLQAIGDLWPHYDSYMPNKDALNARNWNKLCNFSLHQFFFNFSLLTLSLIITILFLLVSLFLSSNHGFSSTRSHSCTYRGGITYGSRGQSPKGCSLSGKILSFQALSCIQNSILSRQFIKVQAKCLK